MHTMFHAIHFLCNNLHTISVRNNAYTSKAHISTHSSWPVHYLHNPSTQYIAIVLYTMHTAQCMYCYTGNWFQEQYLSLNVLLYWQLVSGTIPHNACIAILAIGVRNNTSQCMYCYTGNCCQEQYLTMHVLLYWQLVSGTIPHNACVMLHLLSFNLN